MSILWYVGVFGLFFGGSMLLHQHSEVRALKKELARAREPQPIERKFYCHTL